MRSKDGDGIRSVNGQVSVLAAQPLGYTPLCRPFDCVPALIVEDHEQDWKLVGTRDKMRRRWAAKHVCPLTQGRNNRLLGGRQLHPQRCTGAPAQSSSRGRRIIGARQRELHLREVEIVLVDQNGLVVFHLIDAVRHPFKLNRPFVLDVCEAFTCRSFLGLMLGIDVLEALADGAFRLRSRPPQLLGQQTESRPTNQPQSECHMDNHVLGSD